MDVHPSTGLTLSEIDFRIPEYRDARVEDYEWRSDGKLVRKDRWECGMFRIASILGFNGREGFEIEDVIAAVEELVKPPSTPEKPE